MWAVKLLLSFFWLGKLFSVGKTRESFISAKTAVLAVRNLIDYRVHMAHTARNICNGNVTARCRGYKKINVCRATYESQFKRAARKKGSSAENCTSWKLQTKKNISGEKSLIK